MPGCTLFNLSTGALSGSGLQRGNPNPGNPGFVDGGSFIGGMEEMGRLDGDGESLFSFEIDGVFV